MKYGASRIRSFLTGASYRNRMVVLVPGKPIGGVNSRLTSLLFSRSPLMIRLVLLDFEIDRVIASLSDDGCVSGYPENPM